MNVSMVLKRTAMSVVARVVSNVPWAKATEMSAAAATIERRAGIFDD